MRSAAPLPARPHAIDFFRQGPNTAYAEAMRFVRCDDGKLHDIGQRVLPSSRHPVIEAAQKR